MRTRTLLVTGLVVGCLLGIGVRYLAFGSCFESPYGPDRSFGCRVEESPGWLVATAGGVAGGVTAALASWLASSGRLRTSGRLPRTGS